LGGRTLLAGYTIDITERKQAEALRLESEARYRLLFESASDGIFVQDESGFIDCNRLGAEMYGLTREKVVGRSPGEFAPERQPDGRLSSAVAAEKMRAAMSGVPQQFEWRPLRADGTPFDVEVMLSRFELGGKACLIATVRDIGERKRAQQEMLKSQRLESIGTLAGGIAHDFNNLLQGVFGYLSMARIAHDQREKSLAMLEQAEKALHQAVGLTSQLLTFAKGGKPLKRVIPVRPVIEDAVKFALSGSRVACELSLPDDLRLVDADAGQIGQVIQNIVMNAEQAMPLGGRIELSARNVSAASVPGLPAVLTGDLVEIAIRDEGTGIPPEHLARIFDPYFTTKEKGSGLGLATSHSIVTSHGGALRVTSELGRGSTFTIHLPAAVRPPEGPRPHDAPRVERRLRVLVMDDEQMILDLAGEILRALGHEAEFVGSGEAAIAAYQRARAAGRPFDVVILDLTIRGGLGGVETVRRLLEIDPAVKAVVSSGYSEDAGISSYLEHGFKQFLNKPYSVTDLRRVLNSLA
jgi:PAS domain S-box-containing protein